VGGDPHAAADLPVSAGHEPAAGRPPEVERALRFILDAGSDRFEASALEVFAFQYRHNAPYRRFCDHRGATPSTVRSWAEVPAVPTAAFKEAVLSCAPARRIFRTSGTTGGESARGAHRLPETTLYDAAWPEPFRAHLLPDRPSMRVLSLIPPGAELPESSLSYMADGILARFGATGSGVFLDRQGLHAGELLAALEAARDEGEPVMLLGTALGFAELLEALEARGARPVLPAGSRVMDTGGFKGKTREISREDLLDRYRERLGVPPSHVVGEYGMSEMSSQFYEPSLKFHVKIGGIPENRIYEAPPWVRTRALDPDTLEPLPDRRIGLLAHFDLANAWTVAAIVTEDLGETVTGGFRFHGRAQGAALRGCSLATEELLDG
jgi:hypothetical protein